MNHNQTQSSTHILAGSPSSARGNCTRPTSVTREIKGACRRSDPTSSSKAHGTQVVLRCCTAYGSATFSPSRAKLPSPPHTRFNCNRVPTPRVFTHAMTHTTRKHHTVLHRRTERERFVPWIGVCTRARANKTHGLWLQIQPCRHVTWCSRRTLHQPGTRMRLYRTRLSIPSLISYNSDLSFNRK